MIDRRKTAQMATVLQAAMLAQEYRTEVLRELFDACGELLEQTGGMQRSEFDRILPTLQRMTEALKHAKTLDV